MISRISLTRGLDFLRVLGAVNADGLDNLTRQRECRRVTYLCCTDDDDDDDDHYYDGEDKEGADFDDDNDDKNVLKKVFFSDGHGVFTSRVSFDTKNQFN